MYSSETIKKLRETTAWDGFRKIIARTYLLPSGREFTFEVKGENHSVCVVALTPENEVVLAKQFRPGPERFILELPGGTIDSGERHVDAAARELLEETGYTGELHFVGTNMADGYSTMIRSVFMAQNCKPTGKPQNLDNEQIDVVLMPLAQFRDHLRGGDMTDVGPGYMCLDYLGLLLEIQVDFC